MERSSQNTIIATIGKDLKKAFADECSKRGKSMTQIIRQMTIEYVNENRPKQHKIKNRITLSKKDFGTSVSCTEAHNYRHPGTHPIY